MALGDKIRTLRKQRDWTQQELAAKIGVHEQHVTRWEKNKIKPRANTLAKLAQVFEVGLEELTQDNGSAHLEGLLRDPELLAQFQALTELNDKEREAIKTILHGLIAKNRMKHLVSD